MSQWFSNFHFLRPEFLLLLPLLILLVLLLRKRKRLDHSWETVLPPEFLQALHPNHHGPSKTSSFWQTDWLWPVVAVVAITALAGPSWKKQQTPVYIQQDHLVVVLDLSLSMLATDQTPNRLTRARQKVVDLVNLRKEGQTGLVVFAGSSHTVSPLTSDINTFKAFLPALDPFIMPGLGSNAAAGVSEAIRLLRQAGAPHGRILMLADGIEAVDITAISQQIKESNYQLSIIAMGTPDGGPIPIPNRGFLKENDQIIVARPNYSDMQRLAQQTSGLFSRLTIDNKDLINVLPENGSVENAPGEARSTTNAAPVSTQQTTSNQWHDSGYWLLPILIALALWHFRKAGVALSVGALLLLDPYHAAAFEWQDLWQTPDQQAMELYQRRDYENASRIFNDPQWSGTAHYRAGQYEEALAAFEQDNTAISHFNRGNTLAELQRFDEALQAYDQASKLDPALTKAMENHQKLSDWLKQQKQNNQSNNAEDQGKQEQEQDNQQGNQSNSDSAQDSQDSQYPQDQDQTPDPQGSEGGESAGQDQNISAPETESDQAQTTRPSDENLDSGSGTGNKEESTEDEKPESQMDHAVADGTGDDRENNDNPAIADSGADLNNLKDQQTEQWLRRIPDDPGGLLRRKFMQQYQRQNTNDQNGDNSGSRTLW